MCEGLGFPVRNPYKETYYESHYISAGETAESIRCTANYSAALGPAGDKEVNADAWMYWGPTTGPWPAVVG